MASDLHFNCYKSDIFRAILTRPEKSSQAWKETTSRGELRCVQSTAPQCQNIRFLQLLAPLLSQQPAWVELTAEWQIFKINEKINKWIRDGRLSCDQSTMPDLRYNIPPKQDPHPSPCLRRTTSGHPTRMISKGRRTAEPSRYVNVQVYTPFNFSLIPYIIRLLILRAHVT